jgi:hypothetical protein
MLGPGSGETEILRPKARPGVGRGREVARRGLNRALGEAKRLRASLLCLSYWASHRRMTGGVRAL